MVTHDVCSAISTAVLTTIVRHSQNMDLDMPDVSQLFTNNSTFDILRFITHIVAQSHPVVDLKPGPLEPHTFFPII